MNCLSKWCVLNSGKTLIVGGILFLLLFYGILKLEIKTEGHKLYPSNHEIITQTNNDRTLFKDKEQLILIIRSKESSHHLCSIEGLSFIKKTHAQLQKFPEVDPHSLTSISNQLYRPNNTIFEVKEFLHKVPKTSIELENLLNKIGDFEVNQGLFLSADCLAASIYIPLINPKNKDQFLKKLNLWFKSQADTYEISLLGPAVAETSLGTHILKELTFLIPISLFFITLVIYLLFRNLIILTAILFEIGFVIIGVMGLMGILQIPITIVTILLPILLLSISILDEIHLIMRLRKKLSLIKKIKNQAYYPRVAISIIRSISEIQKPILITSLTTSLGFLSFLTSEIESLRWFGLFAAIGILLAYILTITLIPAFLASQSKYLIFNTKTSQLTNVFFNLPSFVPSKYIFWGLVSLITFLFPLVYKIKVQDSWISNFNANAPLVSAEAFYNEKFWGSYSMDIILNSKPAFFYTKDGTDILEKIITPIKSIKPIEGVLSYVTQLDRIAALMQSNRTFYDLEINDKRQIIQVSKLLKQRIHLSNWINNKGDASRIKIFVKNANYEKAIDLQKKIQQSLAQSLSKSSITYHLSGDLPIASHMVRIIVNNQISSTIFTSLTISLLIGFFLGWKKMLIAILPVLLTAICLFEIMALLGISLGIATSMITAIFIGLGIDTSIYLVNGLNKKCFFTDELNAIFIANLVLIIGLTVFIFSSIKANFMLGLLLIISLGINFFIAQITIKTFIKPVSLKNKREVI